VHKADKITTFMILLSRDSGSFNLHGAFTACTGIALPLPLAFRTINNNKNNVGQKTPRFCNEKFTDTKGRGKTEDNKIELHIKSDITIHLKYETWHVGKVITDRDNSIQVPSAAFFKRQDDIHA